MKVIGITGGIGSGKTTITKYIESLGYPVYIADDEAKKILDELHDLQVFYIKSIKLEVRNGDFMQVTFLFFANFDRIHNLCLRDQDAFNFI